VLAKNAGGKFSLKNTLIFTVSFIKALCVYQE